MRCNFLGAFPLLFPVMLPVMSYVLQLNVSQKEDQCAND